MPAWLQVVGRFHPLVLHLPIGLLAALVALELASLAKRAAAMGPAALLMSILAAVSAVVAAGTGFLLSYEGGFSAQIVAYHQWLGIAVAVGAVITCGLYLAHKAALRRAALLITMGLLLPAGHLGATLTHGEDFLFAPLSEHAPSTTAQAPGRGTTPFEVTVAPVLDTYCSKCHSETKHKGGLTLTTALGIRQGSDDGPVLEPGHPERSEIVRRMRLPAGDDEHMPPPGKPQPSEEQIRAIEGWITAGAQVGKDQAPPPEAPAKPASEGPSSRAPQPTGPDETALTALRAKLVHAEPVAQGSDLLIIDFAAVATGTTWSPPCLARSSAISLSCPLPGRRSRTRPSSLRPA